MPVQRGNSGSLGTMFSPGNNASTASSAGSSMWNTGESQSSNPYPQGISIPGTGANGSATVFQDQWDPATNTWAIKQGADGALAPIYTSADWHSANQTKGLGSNESINGGQLTINNKGGGSTQVGYAPDPKTGYIVPVTSQGIGQKSWWQSTGIPIAEDVGAAALAGPLGGALGGGLVGALGAGGILGGATAGLQGRNIGTGVLTGAAGGGIGYGAQALGAGAAATGAIRGGATSALNGQNPLVGAAAGGVGAGVGAALGGGFTGAVGGSLAGSEAGSLLNSGSNGGGSGVSTSSPNMGNLSGSPFGSGSSLLGSLGSLYNTYQGNQANQQLGSNLMNMYSGAAQQAAPAVNQMNQTIQNPNSYFSSPLYQAQASLYGNNVDAQKNAGGTNGNGIDYTQKMMGFAGQNYDNYLSGLTNSANVGLSNQAKYGQDYAYGTALQNQSNAAANGNYVNGLAGLLGGAGGNSLLGAAGAGLSSLFGGGGSSGTNPVDPSNPFATQTSSGNGAVDNYMTNLNSTGGANPGFTTQTSGNPAIDSYLSQLNGSPSYNTDFSSSSGVTY